MLCDRLEEKMKGTVVDGTVKQLFAGKTRPTTRCLHVDYASSREEDFYDVQLDVKGCVRACGGVGIVGDVVRWLTYTVFT